MVGWCDYSLATLRIFGDDLVPEEITTLLGVEPTDAWVKGKETHGFKTGRVRIEKTGAWRLTATRREPENLEAQVFEILNKMTTDLNVWADISSRYKVDLFCGIFMAGSNDGLSLTSKALLALGVRNILLDLDIYDSSD